MKPALTEQREALIQQYVKAMTDGADNWELSRVHRLIYDSIEDEPKINKETVINRLRNVMKQNGLECKI